LGAKDIKSLVSVKHIITRQIYKLQRNSTLIPKFLIEFIT